MKKLLLYLLPVILLSEAALRQSLLFNGIAVPVLILWLINALLVWMPARMEQESASDLSVARIENVEPAVTELQGNTRQVA